MFGQGEAFAGGLHAEADACRGRTRGEIEARYQELDAQLAAMGLGQGDELRGRLLACWGALTDEEA